jgi:DNA-binding transcriptional LysR family regulator
MPTLAPRICKNAHVVDPADLLALLAVVRGRTFSAAATTLGVNHTTVARRIRTLELTIGERLLVAGPGGWDLTASGRDALPAAEAVEAALDKLPNSDGSATRGRLRGLVRVNSTEVFGIKVVAPALTRVRAEHPGISFELASITRPTPTYGAAADLDVGVTRPSSPRLRVRRLVDYELGLFAAPSYLAAHGEPTSLSDLAQHSPVYYVESMLQVTDLDLIDKLFPRRSEVLGATSVLAQLEMTRRGAGIGLLPVFLAVDAPDLIRVLPGSTSAVLTFWLSGRTENLRRPEVAAVAEAIAEQCEQVFSGLMAPRSATGRRPHVRD